MKQGLLNQSSLQPFQIYQSTENIVYYLSCDPSYKIMIFSIFRIFLLLLEATLCITVAIKQVVTLIYLMEGVTFILAGYLFLVFIFETSYSFRQHPIIFSMTNSPCIPSMQHLCQLYGHFQYKLK